MIATSRRVAQSMLFTKFLVERDCLTASFTRMGSGFTPPSVVLEAKEHLEKINTLMRQMEQLAIPVQNEPEYRMDKSCCGRD